MHILRFFRAVIDQQTWSDGGSVSERRLRSELLSLACHLDDPPCLERARQSFKHWLQSNGTLKYVCLNYILYTLYKSLNSDIIQINSSSVRPGYFILYFIMSLMCTSLLVFTIACQPMWQRQCLQSELRRTTAGLHSYTHTTSLRLQHKKAKSCLP